MYPLYFVLANCKLMTLFMIIYKIDLMILICAGLVSSLLVKNPRVALNPINSEGVVERLVCKVLRGRYMLLRGLRTKCGFVDLGCVCYWNSRVKQLIGVV